MDSIEKSMCLKSTAERTDMYVRLVYLLILCETAWPRAEFAYEAYYYEETTSNNSR